MNAPLFVSEGPGRNSTKPGRKHHRGENLRCAAGAWRRWAAAVDALRRAEHDEAATGYSPALCQVASL
jgi:hypothetical protein